MTFRSFILLALFLTTPYVLACRSDADASDPSRATISAQALHQRLTAQQPKPLVVDVREPHEFRAGHIEGAQLAPLGTVENALATVPPDREIVLVCRSGNRSGQAQRRLAKRGYTNLRNMEGGMLDWADRGLPVVKP